MGRGREERGERALSGVSRRCPSCVGECRSIATRVAAGHSPGQLWSAHVSWSGGADSEPSTRHPANGSFMAPTLAMGSSEPSSRFRRPCSSSSVVRPAVPTHAVARARPPLRAASWPSPTRVRPSRFAQPAEPASPCLSAAFANSRWPLLRPTVYRAPSFRPSCTTHPLPPRFGQGLRTLLQSSCARSLLRLSRVLDDGRRQRRAVRAVPSPRRVA